MSWLSALVILVVFFAPSIGLATQIYGAESSLSLLRELIIWWLPMWIVSWIVIRATNHPPLHEWLTSFVTIFRPRYLVLLPVALAAIVVVLAFGGVPLVNVFYHTSYVLSREVKVLAVFLFLVELGRLVEAAYWDEVAWRKRNTRQEEVPHA